MKALYLIVFIFCSICMNGQVTIKEEPAINKVMSIYESSNKNESFTRGWRIQILTTNDRSEMEAGLQRFQTLYPQIDYKWEHNPPYYQVRIGAYEKKRDLEAFLLELKQEFPSSIPVQDDITKKEILNY